ncbi:MAG: hypothetical protein Q4D81_03390 [Eubacteriales bacterium]|nr:hypothetical protein [Eubacteriales bacterium]
MQAGAQSIRQDLTETACRAQSCRQNLTETEGKEACGNCVQAGAQSIRQDLTETVKKRPAETACRAQSCRQGSCRREWKRMGSRSGAEVSAGQTEKAAEPLFGR